MQSLHPVDITVIVLYLVGITALGVWMARHVKNAYLLQHFFPAASTLPQTPRHLVLWRRFAGYIPAASTVTLWADGGRQSPGNRGGI